MKKTVKKLDDEVRKPAFFEEAITLTGIRITVEIPFVTSALFPQVLENSTTFSSSFRASV